MKKNNLTILLVFIHYFTFSQGNVFYGLNAGNAGTYNSAFGNGAGDVSTGLNSTFIGYSAGLANTSGSWNTFIGSVSGRFTTTGSRNTFLGESSGHENSTGNNNTYLGFYSGRWAISSNNTFIGYESGMNVSNGGSNTILGYQAGKNLISGSGNVFLGFNAGMNETTSNKLYIDNSNTTTPLIYGDFNLNQVGINALPSGFTLNVGGIVNATGLYINGQPIGNSTGQWTTNNTNVYFNSGSVGIGNSSPNSLYKLDVTGAINATTLYQNGQIIRSSPWGLSGTNINYTAGTVSIGTTTVPVGYQLAVGGKIVTEEVVVKLRANWPDYVFEKEYKLPSLDELEQFILINKHLPEVPAASEIEQNGLSIGEMNSILLKKIEELTLYIIQQEKRIKTLEQDGKR